MIMEVLELCGSDAEKIELIKKNERTVIADYMVFIPKSVHYRNLQDKWHFSNEWQHFLPG